MALYFRTTTAYTQLHPDEFAQHLSQHLKSLADNGEIAYKGSLDPQALRHGKLIIRKGEASAMIEAEVGMTVLKDGCQLEADYRMAGQIRMIFMVVGLLLLGWLNVQIFLRPENVSLLTAAMIPGIALASFIGVTAGLFKVKSNQLDTLFQKIVRGTVLDTDNTGAIHRKADSSASVDYPEKTRIRNSDDDNRYVDESDEYDPTSAFRKE